MSADAHLAANEEFLDRVFQLSVALERCGAARVTDEATTGALLRWRSDRVTDTYEAVAATVATG